MGTGRLSDHEGNLEERTKAYGGLSVSQRRVSNYSNYRLLGHSASDEEAWMKTGHTCNCTLKNLLDPEANEAAGIACMLSDAP